MQFFQNRGWCGSETYRKNVGHIEELPMFHATSAFGTDTMKGINGCQWHPPPALIFQEDGDCVSIETYRSIVVAGNGYVAATSIGIYPVLQRISSNIT